MPVRQTAVRPLAHCLRNAQSACFSPSFPTAAARLFANSTRSCNEAVTETALTTPEFNPATVTSKKGEKVLMRSGILPVGSRRRRAAVKNSDNLPFEQLPYQCFQEARTLLQADRESKLQKIAEMRARIVKLEARDSKEVPGGEEAVARKLNSMRRDVEKLKILADINDPVIKMRFEDGHGDMSKAIYRYLADKKWRSYHRKIIVQRIEQMNVVPDVLIHIEPTADVRLAFRRRNVQPGEIVDSRVSEFPPRLNVQVFDAGERLVTIAVVDPDVPLVDKDTFGSRCHFLAANIPLSPTNDSLPLSKITEDKIAHPWLPAFAQKGAPYHRYFIIVFGQSAGQVLDVAKLKEISRDGFKTRNFQFNKKLNPIGLSIFRSVWDEGTAGVMQRAGIEGADIEFKRKRVEPLKPKQKARGWEARHASAKYDVMRRW